MRTSCGFLSLNGEENLIRATLGLGRGKNPDVLHHLELVVHALYPRDLRYDLDDGMALVGTGRNAFERHLAGVRRNK